MYVKNDLDFNDLQNECWECDYTLDAISENNKEEEFMDLLEEQFGGDIPTMTEVNDFIRFEDDFIFDALGIRVDDEEEEEETSGRDRNILPFWYTVEQTEFINILTIYFYKKAIDIITFTCYTIDS